MGHGRAPGVQDTGDTELCTDVLGVSGDGEYGLSRCLEQQVVDYGLVVTGDIGDPPVNTQATTLATLDYRESGLVLCPLEDRLALLKSLDSYAYAKDVGLG